MQEKFKFTYTESIINNRPGRNFLQGMKKIISLGICGQLANERDILLEKILLFNCMFIQNLCERQNIIMKNFLREQECCKFDINIVAALTKTCSCMAIKLDNTSFEYLGPRYEVGSKVYLKSAIDQEELFTDLLLLNQMLKTLTELSQGCLANQSIFIHSNLFKDLNCLLISICSNFQSGINER